MLTVKDLVHLMIHLWTSPFSVLTWYALAEQINNYPKMLGLGTLWKGSKNI